MSMSIRVKLAVYFVVVILAISALFIYANITEESYHNRRNTLLNEALELVIALEKADVHFQKQLYSWSNLLMRGQNADQYYHYLQLFYKQGRKTREVLITLESSLKRYSEAYQEMQKLKKEYVALSISYRKALQIYNQSANPIIDADKYMEGHVRDPGKYFEPIKEMIFKEHDRQIEKIKRASESQAENIFIMSIVSVVIMLALFLWIFDRNMGRPLSSIIKSVSEIDKGDLSKRLNTGFPGEFNLLSSVFNRMMDNISSINEDLVKYAGDLESEIEVRKRLEVKLEERTNIAEAASKSKTEFLSTVNHEIRTPLNIIIGYTELLSTTDLNERQQKYIDSIESGSGMLLGIISDVLDLAKIEAGKLEIVEELSDLSILLDKIKSMFEKQTVEKGLDFQISCDDIVPKVVTLDEHRLKQILLNLISNAIKFTDKGRVSVYVTTSNKRRGVADLIFSVKDDGVGIPEEYHKTIFNVFEQKDGQDARQYGGTGLGLAICQKLATLMNGEISLESKEGEGSTFTLKLNDVTIQEDDILNSGVNRTDQKLPAAKILIVDDLVENRELLRNFLSDHPLTIFEAENGEQAITMTKTHLPDLILMDIKMPGMDGVEATKILREDESTRSIPIVAVTASSIKTSENSDSKDIFNEYLTKPVKLKLLYEALEKYLMSKSR